MTRPRSDRPPLDDSALDRLALRYVERFATSRGRLAAYLDRKLRERGQATDRERTTAIAERMAALGYVDDRAFADARAAGMARQGLGARRVSLALRAAAIEPEEIAAVVERSPPLESALTFARRRRIGPFANEAPERELRERQIAAMIRAGHGYTLARRLAEMMPGDDPSQLDDH